MAVKHRTIIETNILPAFHTGFSVRKLRPAYAGNCMQVRRSSDNTLQNIGFDADGNLDETALLAFVGAGSGFVRTWYDQSGNTRNLLQTTNGNQPRIVNAGVVDKVNGRPCLVFDGTTERLVSGQANSVYNFIHNGGLASIFCVFKSGNSSNPNRTSYIVTTNQNSNGAGYNLFHTHLTSGAQDRLQSRTYKASTGVAGTQATSDTYPPNIQHLGFAYIDTNDGTLANRNYIYKNNEAIQASNSINETPSAALAQAPLQISSRNGLDSFFLGQIQECIIFNSHPDRANVVNFINSYYEIV
jgi:hypothetical protein